MSKPVIASVRLVERWRGHDEDRLCACGNRVTSYAKCCDPEGALVKCPWCGRFYSENDFLKLPALPAERLPERSA